MTLAPEQAFDLLQTAHRLIAAGSWAEAAATLERAAALHKSAGRAEDEARCLQLAATLRRSSGDAARARLLADRAAAVTTEDKPLAVAIATEQAQTAFDEGRFEDSIEAWSRAIESASVAQAFPQAICTLLRKRAAAHAALDDLESAARDFEEAYRRLETGGDRTAAGFVRVEHAGVLDQHGRREDALRMLDSIAIEDNAHLRADTLVMRAKLGREAGRFEEAIAHGRAAREAALEAVAPVSYFAAAAELAQSYDARADLTNSYGALAAAWATLGDLLGDDAARSWVEPLLLAFKFKWGDAAFANAKQAYEGRHV